MKVQSYHARILVKNKPITEYTHKEKTFVEGRLGSEFELELENASYQTVLMIPSVDGLSILDGTPAGDQSQGFVLKPKSTLKIPGWLLDNTTAAKFIFASKKKSYANTHPEHASPTNVGVVGVQVWSEKPKPFDYGKFLIGTAKPNDWMNTPVFPNVHPLEYTQTWCIGTTHTPAIGTGPSVFPPDTKSQIYGGFTADSVRAVNCVYTTPQSSITGTSTSFDNSVPVTDTFSLGAGFGDKTNFKTNNVAFEKADLVATLVLFYDDKKGLQARGIEIAKPKQDQQEPNPFPKSTVGCKPPSDWKF